MSAVLLGSAPKRSARDIVVAPRLPARPETHTGDPFTTEGEIYAECATCRDTGGRRYHVSGPRREVKKALNEHHKMFHSDEIGVVLLNQPRQ